MYAEFSHSDLHVDFMGLDVDFYLFGYEVLDAVHFKAGDVEAPTKRIRLN